MPTAVKPFAICPTSMAPRRTATAARIPIETEMANIVAPSFADSFPTDPTTVTKRATIPANPRRAFVPFSISACEISASRFVLRHNGNVYYGDYTEKREDGEIFVYVTMDEGGEFTARCYLDKSSESKIQLMEIVYNERIYTFRKIA